MTDFEDALVEYLGTVGDTGDIRATVRRCWFFDFADGKGVYLWQGQGLLTTTGGTTWIGTIDANGVDRLSVPSLGDGRDGSSKQIEFSLPYIDADTYRALKAERDMVAGRRIICFVAIFLPGEGLRPQTPIDYVAEFTMQSCVFEERLDIEDGTYVKRYTASVLAKDGNAGRSRAQRGSYTDTSQKKRAALLGVTYDRGCEFVADLANKTLQIP